MRRKFAFLILLILILGLVGCKGVHLGGHSYGQWQTVQEATCLEDGLQERVCACGAKETQALPALGHTAVVDEAKAATCTASGLTEGSHCSRCDAVLQEQQVIAPQHVTEETPMIAPDCTRAGKEAGAYCTVCGEYVVSPQKIRQNGHNYVNGVCTACNAVQPDMAAAIMINELNESGVPNFYTKQAYPAGSTITFDAYVPVDSTWWAVSWIEDPAEATPYKWTEGSGVNMDVATGEWQTCTVTLPSNGGSYYIYIVGAKGEWGNMPLMIDNVTITNASGTVLGTDSFSEDVAGGLFNVVKVNSYSHRPAVFLHEACPGHWYITDAAVEPNCEEVGLTKGYHCGNCGKILKEQEEIPALGHQWNGETCSVCGKQRQDMVAALRIDNFNESAPMNFITKEAYAGGSTVKFQAYVPFGVTWWTVNWTTDPNQGDLYVGFSGQGQDMNGYTQMGQWAEYTINLPDDGKQYYIYFVGAKGEWNGRELLINNLAITDKEGTLLASEDFDSGVKACIFDVTELNSADQSVAVLSKVLEDPCENGHTIVIHPSVEPTCSQPGLSEGQQCSVCGKVLVAQQELPATGHVYGPDGVCECGAVQGNRSVAIRVDNIAEAGKMSFITRDAYAGGSILSFRAYVPEDVTWWTVNWTTDPNQGDLYVGFGGQGQDMNGYTQKGKWANYTVTLPDDGNQYYIYFAGAKGEWNGQELLIDDVVLTDKHGKTVLSDNFDDGMHSGLFSMTERNEAGDVVVREVSVVDCLHANKTKDADVLPTCVDGGYLSKTVCADCGITLYEKITLEAMGHQWENGECTVCHEPEEEGTLAGNYAASIHIDNLTETAPMSFITKQAYPGGSTVKFRAFVPNEATWWTVNWTTDPNQGDLYVGFSGQGQDMNGYTQKGQWAEYTVNLPNDGKQYYIYFVGAKGEWQGKTLLIDDVVITLPGGTAVTEDFNSAAEQTMFNAVETDGTKPVVEWEYLGALEEEEPENRSVAIRVDNIAEAGKMSFITRDAYAGGSILSFRAYVPEDVTWWTVNWTTDPNQGDLYVGFGGQGQDMNGYTQKGKWANYTVTLPDDGKQYYIYFAGAKGEWNGQELLIDDVILTDKHGKTVLSDNFDDGMHSGLFSMTECNEYGDVVVREVFVVDCLHANKTKDADVLPTCVDGGYLSKTVCADCGITLYEKITLEAMGHQWENGECTVCHEPEEEGTLAGNYAASIHIDNLTETAPMSFITKQAYPGGSTVKFRAFVPNEATWWTVNWTTDPNQGDLYVGFSGQGQDMNGYTQKGQWAEYTVNLPNDGKQYYIYFVGAKGEWQGKTLLIDDVVITLPGGTAVTEDFNSAAEQSMFNAVETDGTKPVVEWEYLGALEEEELENRSVAIHVDNMAAAGKMNFITSDAYAGGSILSFRAYVPEDATWWTVNWTTDPDQGDLYVGFSGQGQDMNGYTQKGKWANYTVTLPDDGNQYYIYFAGAKGEWNGQELLIDDVVLTDKHGKTVLTDDFDDGMHSGLFSVTERNEAGDVVVREVSVVDCLHANKTKDADVLPTCVDGGYLSKTVCADCGITLYEKITLEAMGHQWENGECTVCHEPEEEEQPVGNYAASIHIDNLAETAPMSFITKQAYPGGSTVKFQAFVPNEATWWTVNWTTDPNQGDLYVGFSGQGQDMNGYTQKGQWAEYTINLPNDGKQYYIYFVGAKGEWQGKTLLIDDVVITLPGGTAVTEDFNSAAEQTMFNAVETDGTKPVVEWEYLGALEEEEPENRSVAIHVDNMAAAGKMNFITSDAYAGGSILSFRAYVPEDATWWTVNWTTDPDQGDLYVGFGGQGQDMNGYTQKGKWANYTVTLPDDGKQYYIYFAGAKGEWNGQELLIDDVVLTDKHGKTVLTDNFDDGIDNGLFSMTECNEYGDVVVREVFVVDCLHANKTKDADVLPTCVDGGYLSKTVCADCGITLYEKITLEATGHQWENGECTVCHEPEEEEQPVGNYAASIHIDNLTETAPMSFITKQAYPGGSTVKFRAFVPNEATWWTVNWTTDPNQGDLYVGFSGQGQDMNGYTQKGQWAEYTVNLPNDGKQYYIYFVGAKGEWQGKTLLIDDVVITLPGGTAVTEDFNSAAEQSMFNAVETNGTKPVVEWEYLGALEEEEQPARNYAASIHIDNLTETAPMSFITKQAYPGGSTVKFQAFVPNEATWWTVNWTTDPNQGDLYVGFSGQGQDMNGYTQKGQWAEYTVNLPNDGKQYYIYFVGAKGEWQGKTLLIDDVVITLPGGTAVTEDFNSAAEQSMFNAVETNGTKPVVEWEHLGALEEDETPAGNYAASIHIDNLTETAPMSFITKQAYPGGSTVKFQAFVPNEATWWTVNWTTDPNQGDLYVGFSGQGQDMNGYTQKGQWAEYTINLPNDGKQYYIYFVGAKGEWQGKTLLIDDVVITLPGGTAVTEDFNSAAEQSLFNAVETNGTKPVVEWEYLGALEEDETPAGNYAASIYIDNLAETAPMSFITKQAYPGGSTVKFRAFVPNEATWWTVNWTTDPNQGDLYVGFSGQGQDMNGYTQKGQWAEYTVNLPNDGKQYYIYFVGAKGEWQGKTLLIDDVVITLPGGTAVTEDFNSAAEQSMFNAVETNGTKPVVQWILK